MDFYQLAEKRYSCRNFDVSKPVEDEKLKIILETARLAPSACNSQPYHFTVCRGEKAKEVSKGARSMGMNGFTENAPLIIVISEKPYNMVAGVGSKVKHNDYRSIDIGIAAAHIALSASDLGLGSCIVGAFDDRKIREIIGTDRTTRLLVAIGYEKEIREKKPKKRKSLDELVTEK